MQYSRNRQRRFLFLSQYKKPADEGDSGRGHLSNFQELEKLTPERLADDILKKEQRIAELMLAIKEALRAG